MVDWPFINELLVGQKIPSYCERDLTKSNSLQYVQSNDIVKNMHSKILINHATEQAIKHIDELIWKVI